MAGRFHTYAGHAGNTVCIRLYARGKIFGDFNWNKKNFPRAYILPILRLFLRKLVALFHLHFSASETDASKYKGKYYDSQIRRQQLNRKL